MAQAAAYVVLQDQGITLGIGEDIDSTFGFDAPGVAAAAACAFWSGWP
jgi:hypothetical protein